MRGLKCYKNKSYNKIGFTKNSNKERIIDSCRNRGYTLRKKGEKIKSLFSILNELDVMRKKSLTEIGEGLEKATLLNSVQLVYINGNKNKQIVTVETPTREDKSLYFFKNKAQDFIFQEANKARIQLRKIKAIHDIKKTVRKIIFESQLATSIMKEKLVKIFVGCIRSKFREKFAELLIVLEKALRDYFEHQGYSIEETSSNKYISLRHIFRDDEANEYKQELLKLVNENFFFTLGWLLVDGEGGDLRNKIIHSYDEVTEHEVKYAVLLILKLYWAFPKE